MSTNTVTPPEQKSKESVSELSPKMEAPLTLYMYATEDQFHKIINGEKFRLSMPWATNDVTEGVAQGEVSRSGEMEKYGYICLSASCSSPAMWGYYAGRSTGVCLVFTFYYLVPENEYFGKIDGKLPIYRVKYQNERGKTEDGLQLMSIKSQEWAHEKEFRIMYKLEETVCESQDGKVAFYTDELKHHLTGVILGSQCPLKEEAVKGMLRAHKWKNFHVLGKPFIKRARLSTIDFDIDVNSSHSVTLSRPSLTSTIVSAYELIENYAVSIRNWEFRYADTNEFALKMPPDSNLELGHVTEVGNDAFSELRIKVHDFMIFLGNENLENADLCEKIKIIHQYICSLDTVKCVFKRVATYIVNAENIPNEVYNGLCKKIAEAGGTHRSKVLSDVAYMLLLTFVGDKDYPHDNGLVPALYGDLSLCIAGGGHSAKVETAFMHIMKSRYENSKSINTIADEVIEILKQSTPN